MEQDSVIDLSQRMIPSGEVNFKFELDLRDAKISMPQLNYDDDIWYKIGYVSMCTHNGTHIECPYHHLADGEDLVSMPISRLIGNLVLLDFAHKTVNDTITLEDFKQYDAKIKAGDIVFIRTGQDKLFRTENWCDYPYITIDAIKWLIEKKIGCLGTDAAGIEDVLAHNQPGHVTLFRGNIPLVESLTNLDKVVEGEFMVFILPLPIEKCDASPVRIVAVKKSALRKALQ
jgi:Predicted metal-dependent hydrolase